MFYTKTPAGYMLNYPILYFSKRYGQTVFVPAGYLSDGATGAIDIFSNSWWVHDKLCDTGKWQSGELLTNWQASWVLADILWLEKRQFRAVYWWFATFLRGGGEARKNGMFKLKNGKNDEPRTGIPPA